MLGAVAESAALQAINAFGLPNCCVVQQAGGRFLILVPAISQAEEILHQLRSRFDLWLLEKYSGSLVLNLSLSPPFTGRDFKQGTFSEIFAHNSAIVEETKQSPFSTCELGVIKQEFPYDRACDACGARPAQTFKDNEHRCQTCQLEVDLGRRLPQAELMVWCSKSNNMNGAIDVLSLNLSLEREDELHHKLQDLLSIKTLRTESKNSTWALRLLANYIPKFPDQYAAKHPRYDEVVDQHLEPFGGLTKTFGHIAAEALEEREDGTFMGKPFLGLLKADVDHLGAVFSIGLKRVDQKQDRFTLSRMAQLSRMIDLYFTGYFQGVIKRDFPDTYTIYAGGDDLLLIGPWRQMLGLAAALSESFAEYTGHNPHLTLSAGLSLMGPNHPVNRAVKEAEELLQSAKDENPKIKNRIATFGGSRPMSWPGFKSCLANAQWVHEQMQGKDGVSTGFIYHILQIAENKQAAEKGDIRKAGWLARLAYHLARNIKGRDKAERERKRAKWLERLGFDKLLEPSGDVSATVDWRISLSIALYRNRK